VLSSVLLQGQAELIEIYASDRMTMINIPLRELDLPDHIIIAAIRRGLETIIPDGNTVIKDGDRVIIVCLVSDIGYVEKLLRPAARISIRR
jgi:trk system potassium uptake protein TrkA